MIDVLQRLLFSRHNLFFLYGWIILLIDCCCDEIPNIQAVGNVIQNIVMVLTFEIKECLYGTSRLWQREWMKKKTPTFISDMINKGECINFTKCFAILEYFSLIWSKCTIPYMCNSVFWTNSLVIQCFKQTKVGKGHFS